MTFILILLALFSALCFGAVIKPQYGSSNQAITITFTSLTNGSARASTVVDNTGNLYEDVLVVVKVKTASSSTSSTGCVNIYAYATADNGTTYPEAITGSDAGVTLTSPPNLIQIGSISAVANSTTYSCDPISVAWAFGGRLPAKWGIVVENKTGATLDASIGSAWYQGLNDQAV